jgi:hypothetical protein
MESAFYTAIGKRSDRIQEFECQRPKDALTFTPFQVVDICASILELPADILNLLPDTANFEERFELDVVQAEEDSRDNDEKRGE